MGVRYPGYGNGPAAGGGASTLRPSGEAPPRTERHEHDPRANPESLAPRPTSRSGSRLPEPGITPEMIAHWAEWLNLRLAAAGWAVFNPHENRYRYYPDAWDRETEKRGLDLKWRSVLNWLQHGTIPRPAWCSALADMLGLHPLSVFVNAGLMSKEQYGELLGLHAGMVTTRAVLEQRLASLQNMAPEWSEPLRRQWIHDFEICEEIRMSLDLDYDGLVAFAQSLDDGWDAERVSYEVAGQAGPIPEDDYATQSLRDAIGEMGVADRYAPAPIRPDQQPGPRRRPGT